MRNRKMRKMTHSIKATRGMTLIELSVVLLILVALAGMTLPYLSGTTSTAVCTTTDTTLAGIRDSILGTGAIAGFKSDLGMMPTYVGQPTNLTASNDYMEGILSELYNNPVIPPNPSATPPTPGTPPLPAYSVTTQHGWNGPYLTNGATCANAPQTTLCDCSKTAMPGVVFVLDSYSVNTSQQTCSDGITPQKDPIQLQHIPATTTQPEYYFLVSGGRNGIINTTSGSNTCSGASALILATRNNGHPACANDDRVLVLNAVDPGANAPCNQ